VVQAEVLPQKREYRQVDQVPRAADEAELDQLHPVGGLARAGADAACQRDRAGIPPGALVEARLSFFQGHL
jgi:hypothetical protein